MTISYRKPAFARCRQENRTRIDALVRERKVIALMPSELERIGPNAVVLSMQGERKQIRNDDVIVQIGGTAPAELLARFGVEVVTKYGESQCRPN